MAIQLPVFLPMPWAQNGQKASIPSSTDTLGRASYEVGFPEVTALPLAAGGIPPNYLDFQGILHSLSAHIYFIQSGSLYTWQNSLDYLAGAIVLGPNGKAYQAISNSGPSYGGAKTPASNTNYWSALPTSQDLTAFLPLDGSKQMTGGIVFGNNGGGKNVIVANDNTGYLQICGGTSYGNGASVQLHGKGSDKPGAYIVHCSNEEEAADLELSPTIAKWKGQQVLTARDFPAGTVIAYAGNPASLPGFILCNGATVSRTTYAELFSAIGTTYGEGDGSTTFALPRLTDLRFIQGSGTAGVVREPGLPNITGHFSLDANSGEYWTSSPASGAFTRVTAGSEAPEGDGVPSTRYEFNAANVNALYGSSSTVQPLSLSMRYYIKY